MSRHSCPRGILTTQCNLVMIWEPSSRISRPLCKPRLAIMKEHLFLDQTSQWLDMLREVIWSEDNKSSKHITLRTCVNDLVFHERKRNKTFTYSRRKECTWTLGNTLLLSTYSSWARHKDNAFKSFIVEHGEVEGVSDGLNNNPSRFWQGWISKIIISRR